MKTKWLAVGIILLMVIIPCIASAESQGTSSTGPVKFDQTQPKLYNYSLTFRCCLVKSGNVRHTNYQGRFFGITVSNPEIYKFGVGTFQLDLLGVNNSRRLSIFRFANDDFFHQDVRISVKTFIGCFQPTGDLSGGTLSGFAFRITVYF